MSCDFTLYLKKHIPPFETALIYSVLFFKLTVKFYSVTLNQITTSKE